LARPVGFDSTVALNYGIACIPTCLYVRNKKVCWKGSPIDRNLDADINGLLGGIHLVYIEPKEELDAESESMKKLLEEAQQSYTFLTLPAIYLNHSIDTDG
jgi:hypothetical protein